MTEITAAETWSSRLTRHIAAQIRYRRRQRKWSAQRLSDECANLGLDFPRSTLADLENGRRANISVAELLAVASALKISPADLLPADDAIAWIRAGTVAVTAEDAAAWSRAETVTLPAVRRMVAQLSRLIEAERTTTS